MTTAVWRYFPSAANHIASWTCSPTILCLKARSTIAKNESPRSTRKNREKRIELREVGYTLLVSGMLANLLQSLAETLSFVIANAFALDLLSKQEILECGLEAGRQDRRLRYLRASVLHLQKIETQRVHGAGNEQGLS